MNNILANKFMDFLTDTIPTTKIPIWVALVAATVLIIILAVIILVCVSKKSKKNSIAPTIVEPIAQSAASADLTDDEIAFDEVDEAIELDDFSAGKIAQEPTTEETFKPIVSEQPKVIAPSPAMATAAEPKAVAPMATTVAEPVTFTESSLDDKVINPIAKPMVKTSEDTATEVLAKPIAEPMAKPVAQPMTKPVAQPMAKPVAQPMTKPVVAQPMAKPVAQPMAKPVAQPMAKPVAQPMAKPVAQPMAKPVAQPVAKPVAQPVAKPVAKAVVKAEPIKKVEAPKEPEIRILDEDKETFGKYVIRNATNNPDRPFSFELVANNGQLLFESESFKQKPRQASIDAFKKHVKEGTFVVDEDKQGTFRYKLYSNKNLLIGVGETYKTKASCESSVESVKRFAESATIVEDKTV